MLPVLTLVLITHVTDPLPALCLHLTSHPSLPLLPAPPLANLSLTSSPRLPLPHPLHLPSCLSTCHTPPPRALYAVLLTPGPRSSSGRAPQFMSLLFKALKADVSAKRVAAFVKRLLQVGGVGWRGVAWRGVSVLMAASA